MRLLLLGGTAEARALAADLVADGIDVMSSLAGRVARPRMPVGPVRVGGFGGVDGLRSALAEAEAVPATEEGSATPVEAPAEGTTPPPTGEPASEGASE